MSNFWFTSDEHAGFFSKLAIILYIWKFTAIYGIILYNLFFYQEVIFLNERIQKAISAVKPADKEMMTAAKERQGQLAKPPGSLGVLEDLSVRVAGMTGKLHNKAEKCRIIVLCSDNGVCDEGVSCTPQSVTLSQTINLTRGMTGASSLAKHFGDELVVVDVGVMSDYNCPAVINRKIAYGTKNIYHEHAMTREQAEKAICVGLEMADKCAEDGIDAIGVGEMGIGNTTTSSAVLSAFTGESAYITAGKGGGLLDEAYKHKIEVIDSAIAKHKPNPDDPVDVISKVGGFDIAAMCGVFLGAAEHRIPVVIDGFISIVAALCAARLCPDVKNYLIASHASFEPGYVIAMNELGLEAPLLMKMRLGEGSGCPIMFRILDAAYAIMNEMATFDEASIDDSYLDEIRVGDHFTVER